MKIKFVSLNLWLGGVLFDQMLDFLKKENPDILAAQEVYKGENPVLVKLACRQARRYRSLDLLKKELNYDYAAFAPAVCHKLENSRVELGNAIFSRFPVASTKTIFYDTPYDADFTFPLEDFSYVPRNLLHTVLAVGDERLNAFCTQGIWGFGGKDNDRRLRMGEIISNEVRGKENVILAGDFNIDPSTQTIAKIEKHLKSVFGRELTSTFNMKRKSNPGYASAAVDMVFASENIKVIERDCKQVDISDHLPLTCVFDIF